MAEVATYCTHCGAKIEATSKFCSSCGRGTPLAGRAEEGGVQQQKRASAAWYLLPIFFAFLGGLLMFFVIKDEDRGRAKGGLKLGIILSVVLFIFWLLILAAVGSA
jgi:hypothetical protein